MSINRALALIEDNQESSYGSMTGGAFDDFSNRQVYTNEQDELEAKLLARYRATLSTAKDVTHIAGRNMLQITVCNEQINEQGFLMTASLSHNTLINFLEDKGLDLEKCSQSPAPT